MTNSSNSLARRWWWVAVAAILLLAAWLRLEGLDRRPMHTDEAVQGIKFGQLLDEGFYEYDPTEYHGPTLYYATLPVAWIKGRADITEVREADLRLIPALAGWVAVWLALGFRRWLGRAGTLTTLLLLATTTPLVYFSRYYIQEMLLVMASLAFIAAALRWLERPSPASAVAAGLAVGVMHATKETTVLVLASFTVSLGLAWGFRTATSRRALTRDWLRHYRHLWWALLAAASVSVILFSSFGEHPRGPVDSLLTYFHKVERAGGQGHEKPWWWMWDLLWGGQAVDKRWWTQAPLLLLAGAGSFAAWKQGRDHLAMRVVALFPWILLIIHSLIPYKTPWLVLTPVAALTICAGFGVRALALRGTRLLLAASVVVVALGLFDVRQTLRANGPVYCAFEERNPWAYSHTTPQLLDLVQRMEDLAELHPDGRDLLIQVAAPEVWPLPWYLRDFQQTGWWTELPDSLVAPVIITDARWSKQLEDRLPEGYIPSMYGLRPGIILLAYIDPQLWNTYLENQP